MHVRVIQLAAAWLLAGGVAAATETPAYAGTVSVSIEVKSHKERMSVTKTVDRMVVLLTDKATEEKSITVREPTFGELKDFELFINDKKLSKGKIHDVYPRTEDVFFPEKRVKVALLPDDLKIDDTVRYHYKIEYEDMASVPMFVVGNDMVTLSNRLRLKYPKEWTPHFEFSFIRDSIPCELFQEKDDELVLRFDSIPYIEPEPYLYNADMHALVLIEFTDEDGQMLTPVSERDFASWYGGLTPLLPTIAHGGVPSALLKSDEAPQNYLSRINDFVRESIRYVAVAKDEHAIVPDAPDVVLERMWGDCKDRAALVTALSRGEGLDVNMALVGPGTTLGLHGIHPSMFNHVICHWAGGGEDLFFDPTARYRQWGDLSEPLVDTKALVLDPDNPRFVMMHQRVTEPFIDILLEGSADQLSEVHATVRLRRSAAVYWQFMKAQLDPSNEGTAPDDWLSSYVRGLRFDDVRQQEDSSGEVLLTATANLSQFLVLSDTKIYAPSTLYSVIDKDVFKRENDSLPLQFDDRQWLRTELVLEAPGYGGDDSLTLSTDDVISEARLLNSQQDSVRLIWEYRRLAKTMAGDVKESFLAMCREYLASRNRLFVMKEEL